MTKASYIYVHLADNEWGNELMGKIALETFTAHPDKENLFVEVNEHGGWFLIYFKDGDEVTTVGSANDMAVYGGWKNEIRKTLYGKDVEWTYLPEVRRGVAS